MAGVADEYVVEDLCCKFLLESGGWTFKLVGIPPGGWRFWWIDIRWRFWRIEILAGRRLECHMADVFKGVVRCSCITWVFVEKFEVFLFGMDPTLNCC